MWLQMTSPLTVSLVVFCMVTLVCAIHPYEKGKLREDKEHVADTFRLAAYYGDHMVLQRAPESAVIWGYAPIGSQISAVFAGQMYKDMANQQAFGPDVGVWRFILSPQPAGGPHQITITCNTSTGVYQKIQMIDFLFGDVWVCSGQSNMAFKVDEAYNASAELNASTQFPNIRVTTMGLVNSSTPLYDIQKVILPWSLPSPSTLGGVGWFSAVCWFYGRTIYQAYGVPIGLIESNWGGTLIQTWSPPDVIDKCIHTSTPTSKNTDMVPLTDQTGYETLPTTPRENSVLWNAMIHPLLNMTIKGAIWYQGEANAGNPDSYKCLFPDMISSWRERWHVGSQGQTNKMFPFGFVQLCTSNTPMIGQIGGFTKIRWHQTAFHGYAPNPDMPNVFMATALDLPDLESPHNPVHPRDKQDVGLRLSRAGRAIAYGEKGLVYQGPFPTKITLNEAQQTIDVMYNNIGSDHIKLVGESAFEVCCSFQSTCQPSDVWLPITIMPLKNLYALTLSYNCLKAQPVALRYLWRDYPCTFKKCTVYTEKNDLPALPFWLALK